MTQNLPVRHRRTAPQEGVAAQLDRRRQVAHRCVPLDVDRLTPLDCLCRDPWTCRCHETVHLTDQYVDGWRDAALHFAALGMAIEVPVVVGRELWRRGGEDRALIEHLRFREGRP